MIQYTYQSPIGLIIILADTTSLKGLWFKHQTYFGGHYPLSQIPIQTNDIIERTKIWLDLYFAGLQPQVDSSLLAPDVTNFQRQVYQILSTIPYGHTTTYKDISDIITTQNLKPSSPRAVGRAISHNPISLLIPCHRVLGSNGSLTGYAGGLDRKTFLLNHEGVHLHKS